MYILMYIKMSGNESRPRKVELTHTHSKNRDYCCEYFTHNNGAIFISTKTSLMAMIFLSLVS